MSTYIHYTNLGQRPIADLTAKRLLKKGAKLSKKLNKKEDISQSDVDNLEKFADRILKKYDIDVGGNLNIDEAVMQFCSFYK